VSPGVLRIILHQFSVRKDLPNLVGRNHSLGVRHLPDGMREKQELLLRALPNEHKNVFRMGHSSIVTAG
jgi:hypothetical protein